MLAGDGASVVNTQLHDLFGHRLDAFHLVGITSIIADIGVQIAIARVEHVGDHQAGSLGDLIDLGEHGGQAGPRHCRVLNQQVRGETSHRTKGFFAALPERGTLLVIARLTQLQRVVRRQDRSGLLGLGRKPRLVAIEFDHEHGAGIARIARGKDALLDRRDRVAIHDLERGRQQSTGHQRRNCCTRLFHAPKRRQQRAHPNDIGNQASIDLGDQPEATLRSDKEPGEIKPACIALSIKFDDLALGSHHREPHDVARSHAILETVRAPRVLRDIATDRAGGLR